MATELTFNHFQAANRARCEAGFFALDQWSIAEWTNAMAGESGEACNIAKKLIRGDYDRAETISALLDLAEELADVITYADLCMSRVQHSLEELGVEDSEQLNAARTGNAVAAKFNKVSQRLAKAGKLAMLESTPGEATLPHQVHNHS
ncbi:MAG TPA: hypothetical protein DCY79_21515 [Planctomycetaceae bacterium]|nr:hypothetical protein [Blastopirellula sp.]HAY82395.1 hypothetical protein [Planctomycetaceae bacterium]|tara:strand:+ start:276 stop:719 length:444 start_codon:yes stop_codon:yes gene_type:complete